VVVVQTPDGVRYSVEDPSGEQVADRLTREELKAFAPQLAERLDSATANPVMADIQLPDPAGSR
jgi:hypothetical protein